ncbi:alpha/beta fold hydrolase [Nocardioides sp. 503]|uniref:alpha/beta fold hydrolase n=1 Tax=Nocardioides sp. 503 TaxID=2508326 RepID=UPI001ADB9ACF|nr:alpha/beta fold hydrolase [Nocardioides sp. 503]
MERALSVAASNLHWARPAVARGTGVLVLAGSSGRVDVGRAELLATYGVTALALRWFGAEGQPAVPREVPLATFTDALDLLVPECDRVVLMGLSYGAEAALLTAVVDDRVDAVVALAPTDVAWEGQAERDDDPPRSKWTHHGRPVPFVPLDRAWEPSSGRPSYVELYERSLASAGADVVSAATITVEAIGGDVVLVAGGDDRVWPSSTSAERIAARRAATGLRTVVVVDPTAGHPVVLPGESVPDLRRPYDVGGDEGAPQRLGSAAWPAIRRVLHLSDSE